MYAALDGTDQRYRSLFDSNRIMQCCCRYGAVLMQIMVHSVLSGTYRDAYPVLHEAAPGRSQFPPHKQNTPQRYQRYKILSVTLKMVVLVIIGSFYDT